MEINPIRPVTGLQPEAERVGRVDRGQKARRIFEQEFRAQEFERTGEADGDPPGRGSGSEGEARASSREDDAEDAGAESGAESESDGASFGLKGDVTEDEDPSPVIDLLA